MGQSSALWWFVEPAQKTEKNPVLISCHYDRISVTSDGYNGQMATITGYMGVLLIGTIHCDIVNLIYNVDTQLLHVVWGTHYCHDYMAWAGVPFLVRVYLGNFLAFSSFHALLFSLYTLSLFFLLLLSQPPSEEERHQPRYIR